MLTTIITKDRSLMAKHSIKVLCLQSHRDLLRALGVQNGSVWLALQKSSDQSVTLITFWSPPSVPSPDLFYLSLLTSWCYISFNPSNLTLTHMVPHSDLPSISPLHDPWIKQIIFLSSKAYLYWLVLSSLFCMLAVLFCFKVWLTSSANGILLDNYWN